VIKETSKRRQGKEREETRHAKEEIKFHEVERNKKFEARDEFCWKRVNLS
jgi:hypothetical protein